jgi:hypothetical protein
LKEAVAERNRIEKSLGKPRTDDVLRSFGYAQGRAWQRRGKKIVKSAKRRRRK